MTFKLIKITLVIFILQKGYELYGEIKFKKLFDELIQKAGEKKEGATDRIQIPGTNVEIEIEEQSTEKIKIKLPKWLSKISLKKVGSIILSGYNLLKKRKSDQKNKKSDLNELENIINEALKNQKNNND